MSFIKAAETQETENFCASYLTKPSILMKFCRLLKLVDRINLALISFRLIIIQRRKLQLGDFIKKIIKERKTEKRKKMKEETRDLKKPVSLRSDNYETITLKQCNDSNEQQVCYQFE